MSSPTPGADPARAFAGVADAYDSARPSYPLDAAHWLVDDPEAVVLELGAGTGKLTEQLAAVTPRVVATDPLEPMLDRLRHRVPRVAVARAAAEAIPMTARSVDVVAVGQAFHWFDLALALPEIARVLRPGGRLALVWNLRDERVPWVRRLSAALGGPEPLSDPTHALQSSHLFGYVETAEFRFWQPLDRARLRDLVRSRSYIATRPEAEQQQVLAAVDRIYDDYAHERDGVLLPYRTFCYRAVVRAPAVPEDDRAEPDDGSLIIDFP
jgi:SAM-dependent methyltransferase